MQKSKQITYAIGSVCSAGMLCRNHISGSCLLSWCLFCLGARPKQACYKDLVDPLGQHTALPNREGSCVNSSDN